MKAEVRETAVAVPAWWRVLTRAGLPPLGAALGLAVPPAARWFADLPWVPFRGPARLITSLPEPQAVIGAVVLGVLAGLALLLVIRHEELGVTVADERVVLRRKGAERSFARTDVGAVFLARDRLVLLGPDTRELADHEYWFGAARLAAAFRAHGFPWTDADPYEDEYRRWVPDAPGLPPGADALFKAREKAKGDDAAELRAELGRLGVVVRDRDGRQHWRPAPPEG